MPRPSEEFLDPFDAFATDDNSMGSSPSPEKPKRSPGWGRLKNELVDHDPGEALLFNNSMTSKLITVCACHRAGARFLSNS